MIEAQINKKEQISLASEKPSLFKNKQFFFLLSAYTISIFGNSFHNIALNLWVLTETGSAKMMTIILVTNLAVGALFGSIAGTITDRFDRRKIMLICDILRCILVLVIALCIALPNIPFVLIVILTAIVTFLGLFQSPSLNASLINIVGKSNIQRASGLMNISDNISRTVGFVAGGLFVAAFGGVWAIVFDGFAFLVSFILIFLAGRFPSPRISSDAPKNSFWHDLLKGFTFIRTDAFAKAVTILSPTLLLFFMSALMLTQVMAVTVWDATAFEFGLIEACIPLGYMIGAWIIVLLGTKIQRRGLLIVSSLLLMGPTYIALSFSSSAGAAIPFILLIGFMFSFCTLLIHIILRLEISEDLQGRVFGIMGSLNSVVPSLGLIFSSFVADSYGSNSIMLFIGISLTCFAIIATWRLKVIRAYN